MRRACHADGGAVLNTRTLAVVVGTMSLVLGVLVRRSATSPRWEWRPAHSASCAGLMCLLALQRPVADPHPERRSRGRQAGTTRDHGTRRDGDTPPDDALPSAPEPEAVAEGRHRTGEPSPSTTHRRACADRPGHRSVLRGLPAGGAGLAGWHRPRRHLRPVAVALVEVTQGLPDRRTRRGPSQRCRGGSSQHRSATPTSPADSRTAPSR